MTDNEIIKAFECCNNDGCENCPNRPTCCEIDVTDEILNIINRQKAEIEGLKAIADAELDTIHDLGEDYERMLEEEYELIEVTKIKAIDEFLDKFDKRCLDSGVHPGFIRKLLEIVRNDMVGE